MHVHKGGPAEKNSRGGRREFGAYQNGGPTLETLKPIDGQNLEVHRHGFEWLR